MIILIVMIGMIRVYYYNQFQQEKKEVSVFIEVGHEQLREGIKDACRKYNLVLNFFEVSPAESNQEVIKRINREDEYGVAGILLAYLNRPDIYSELTSLSSKLLVIGDKCEENIGFGYPQSDLIKVMIDNLKVDMVDIYYQEPLSNFDQLNKMMIESALKNNNIEFQEVKIANYDDMTFTNPFIIFQSGLIDNELLKTVQVDGYLFGCFQSGVLLIEQNEYIKMIYYNDYLLGYQSVGSLIDLQTKQGHYYFYLNQDNIYDNQYSELIF